MMLVFILVTSSMVNLLVSGTYVAWWEYSQTIDCIAGDSVVSNSKDYLYSTATSLSAAGWTRIRKIGFISDSQMSNTVSICKFYMGFYELGNIKVGTCQHRFEKGYNDGTCDAIPYNGHGVRKGWVWGSIEDCELDTGFCGYCKEIYLFEIGANHQYRRDGFSPGIPTKTSPKYVILSADKPTEPTCTFPTPSPTFEPCPENIAYNIQFIIDESGSVNEHNTENYGNSIDFVIDLIENDVSINSKVSAIAFSSVNDVIYSFDNEQNDNRIGIITALDIEKQDYAGQDTNTYNALTDGLEQFKNTQSLDGNILILITDGKPTSGITNICDQTLLLNDFNANNIRIITIGITSSFDPIQLECLSDTNDVFTIQNFTSQDFKNIEQDIRDILCPSVILQDSSHGNIQVIDYKNIQFIVLNAFISVITSLSVIGLCLSIFYCMSRKQKVKYAKVES